MGEALGLAVWTEDEFGPYQAIPQPGRHWRPQGEPLRRPHEYTRGGTARLLALFRPATGELRAVGAYCAANAVLHPWLMQELEAIEERCPPVAEEPLPREEVRRIWEHWQEGVCSLLPAPPHPLPPLRSPAHPGQPYRA
jgi:hypothetical protein